MKLNFTAEFDDHMREAIAAYYQQRGKADYALCRDFINMALLEGLNIAYSALADEDGDDES